MKKFTLVFLLLFSIFVSLFLCSCDDSGVTVTSTMTIDNRFSGEKTVEIVFPLSAKIDDITETIVEKSPNDIDGVSFEYLGVEESGYCFELKIIFNSRDDYENKISLLIGQKASVFLSLPNSVLAHGIRMKEDFDTSSLVTWIERVAKENKSTSQLIFEYPYNTISVDGAIYTTSSTTNIIERAGEEINSISIDTANKKDGTFDRTITFSIPLNTYEKLGPKLDSFFVSNTMPEVKYYGFSDKGEDKEYKVIYEDASIGDITKYTEKLLCCDDIKLSYEDKNNSSTPLSEGLAFEESFNTFSFIGKNNKPVEVFYTYSLPVESVHGDGRIKNQGKWEQGGLWENGVYSVSTTDDVFEVSIPDGMQYKVSKINMYLELLSENSFQRITEFVYDTDKKEDFDYAVSYFTQKGSDIDTEITDEQLICKVISAGSAGEITDSLVKNFGSGNYVAYSRKNPVFSLSTKTNFVDNINIGYMLNQNNIDVPITYTVKSSSEENIYSLKSSSGDVVYKGKDPLIVNVKQGKAIVEYNGSIPNVTSIVIYIVFTFMLVCVFIFIVVIRRNKKVITKVSKNDRIKDIVNSESNLSQTTIFDISELTDKLKGNKDE